MGVDLSAAQLLVCAKNLGVDFSETMMLGRQTLTQPPAAFASALAAAGLSARSLAGLNPGDFAEPLFDLMGAASIRSMDVSDFEGATDIHDLNEPIPPALAGTFSLVFDGGSIEHVFNAPRAFQNAMEMTRVGGHFVQINVANNSTGHGFWQFSPELIFRMFAPENGFELRGVFLRETWNAAPWHRVADPAMFPSRHELRNWRQTYICCVARRISDAPVFAKTPQQSFYAANWLDADGPSKGRSPMNLRRRITRPIQRAIRRARNWAADFAPFDRPCYTRVPLDDFLRGRF